MRDFIQSLSDLNPTVAPSLETVSQQAGELQGSVETLMSQVETQQSELQSMKGDIEGKVTSLIGKAGEEQGSLEQQVTDISSKTDELRSRIEESKNTVVEGLEAVQGQMTELKGHIDDGREAIEGANEAAQGVISQAQEHIQAGQHALMEAVDLGNRTVDGLREQISQVKSETEATALDYTERIDEGIRDTGARVEEMVGMTFDEMNSTFTGAMEMLQGNIVQQGVQEALSMLDQEIQTRLQEILRELTGNMCGVLEDVREKLFGDMENSGATREVMDLALEALDPALEPLFAVFDGFKSLAAMVGIDL
jgi:SMC interacting uncharacterized protein involved in chromosome segregation